MAVKWHESTKVDICSRRGRGIT